MNYKVRSNHSKPEGKYSMNKKRQHDQNEERFFVNQYANYLNVPQDSIEHPISSIKQNQLNDGQSMPDAILSYNNEKKIIEVTTFSRCQEMQKQIGAIIKYPERFPTIINGISTKEFNSLAYELHKTITKKRNKKYEQCVMLCGAISTDLVVGFRNNDPFLTKASFDQFVETMKDKNILVSWEIDLCPFDNIILTAYVIDYNIWYTVNLVDTTIMAQLKEWRTRKTELLEKISIRQASRMTQAILY